MYRHQGECPLCGKPKLSVDETHEGVALIACSVCSEKGEGRGFVRAVAAALGITVAELVNAPEKFIRLWPLGSDVNGTSDQSLGPAPLPSSARADGWCERLLATPGAWAHAHIERGVSLEVIRDCRVGYGDYEHARPGRTAFMFPCFDRAGLGRELIGLSMRYWPSPMKDTGVPYNLRGQPASIFPRPPEGEGPLLICEGEWDVLAARSRGVEAVTSTAGQHFDVSWDVLTAGRRVVVAYDAGAKEHERARVLADRLGGRALDMSRFGVPYDIGDLARDRPRRFKRLIGGS